MIKISKVVSGKKFTEAYSIYADDEGLLEFLQLDEGKESFGITSSEDGTLRVFPVDAGPKFRDANSPETPWRIVQSERDRTPDGIGLFALTDVDDYEIHEGVMTIRIPKVRVPRVRKKTHTRNVTKYHPAADRSVRKMETVLHDFKDLGNAITTKPRPLAPDCVPDLVRAINTLKHRMNGDLDLRVDDDGFLEAFVVTKVRYGREHDNG